MCVVAVAHIGHTLVHLHGYYYIRVGNLSTHTTTTTTTVLTHL